MHTYPNIFKSATFSFRIRLPSTRIRWIRHTQPQLFKSAFQSENFWIRYESGIVWTLNPHIFHPVTSQDQPSSLPWILYSRRPPRHILCSALLPIIPEEPWVLEWIRIRVGYVWTGKFDLNMDTCGRGNFLTRKEQVADSKIRVDGARDLFSMNFFSRFLINTARIFSIFKTGKKLAM